MSKDWPAELPAPDPPTKGWWIDPQEPNQLRRHNGKRWTTSTIDRELIQRDRGQGVFLLGAGKDGIPTGAPLAEPKGRYLGTIGIWAGILAICGGFTGIWIGINHDAPAVGYPGLAVVLGMFAFFGVTAWRAGRRLPGMGGPDSWKVLRVLVPWASIIVGSALATWIAPALNRRSIAYDWCNRIGIFLLDGTVCGLSLTLLWLYFFAPDRHEKRGPKTLILVIGLAITAFFLWRTWDRILDALWVSNYGE